MNIDEIRGQIKALQDTLTNALAEAKNLNARADTVVDKGLDAIEQSRYSAPIVIGISVAMLTAGGLLGYAVKVVVG
ncbi:hypothetical protein [Nitrosovibrio sp. Nv6]|uniref:hypothetical protein n=1 Tax=Nitrosovibrio sp. Nv6 TaxID=1855340 RepID=UPI000B8871D3|nr:hypothetical protein [Nitrosovibrio sp. Nv6]